MTLLSIVDREVAAASRWPGLYTGLTFQQAELLSFIREHVAKGITPSFEEMKDAMGLKSKAGIHRLVSALEERGYISRLRDRKRAIWPTDAASSPSNRLSGFSTSELVAELMTRGFSFTGVWAA